MHSKLSVRGNNHQFIRRLFKQFTTSSTLFVSVYVCTKTMYAWQREKRNFYYRQNAVYPISPVYVCVCAWVCVHEGTCESAATSQRRWIFQQGIYNNYNFNAWCIKEMLFFVQLYGKFCYILAGQKIQTFPWYIMHWWLNNEIKLDPFTNNPILLVIDLWRKKRWIKINAAYHSFFSFLWGWGLDVWGEKHQAAELRHHEVCWIK